LGDHYTVRAAGADLIVSGLSIPSSTYYWVIFLVLIVVGIVGAGRLLASPLSRQAYLGATPIDRIPVQMMMS